MTRVDFLAAILAALLLTLTTAAVFSAAPAEQAQCSTDSECAELCRPDDDECDGGPQS